MHGKEDIIKLLLEAGAQTVKGKVGAVLSRPHLYSLTAFIVYILFHKSLCSITF